MSLCAGLTRLRWALRTQHATVLCSGICNMLKGLVRPCRICVGAFVRAMLAGETQPGVWFPEERSAISDRRALLAHAAEGTIRFELNRPPWALETNPKRLGFGMYW